MLNLSIKLNQAKEQESDKAGRELKTTIKVVKSVSPVAGAAVEMGARTAGLMPSNTKSDTPPAAPAAASTHTTASPSASSSPPSRPAPQPARTPIIGWISALFGATATERKQSTSPSAINGNIAGGDEKQTPQLSEKEKREKLIKACESAQGKYQEFYNSLLFGRIRIKHSKEGQDRAQQLVQDVNNAPDSGEIQKLLKKHFHRSEGSCSPHPGKIRDHSFDTFLLKEMREDEKLSEFLLGKYVKDYTLDKLNKNEERSRQRMIDVIAPGGPRR
jgi:hypothetical protein